MPISKVLIANRGEIAVRIARACADAGLGSVAVYAEPDRDALHVKVADEAYALGGSTPGESYLLQEKLLDVARQAGANAVHPGYGFLAENASFAQAVIDAGLTWIGPSPEAIDSLGDKVKARHIALEAEAPLVPGTTDPVDGPDEVVAFATEHGLPVAIKAAYGGGGRGLKVARTMEEIPDLFDSAVREAVTAFGRGECFVERFLDRPRHVETQCLADQHGNVVVVSTRDCSLQRRNQKLVEEAPAPFLSEEQHAELVRASKAILRQAGYVGAGTCEFLVGPEGDISFLEVNTRLQVEHPVTEEVTGVDLVREQFRIADGEELGYDDPVPHAHSFEFRLNAEDAGRDFMPAPGTALVFRPPSGPGVRLDSGVLEGDTRWPAPSTRCSPSSSSPGGPGSRRWSARAGRSPSSSWRVCPPCSPSTGPWSPTPRSPQRTRTSPSPCIPAGSRPTSTTRSSPTPGRPPRTRASRASGRTSSSRSAASGSRSRCPPGCRSAVAAVPRPAAAGARRPSAPAAAVARRRPRVTR